MTKKRTRGGETVGGRGEKRAHSPQTWSHWWLSADREKQWDGAEIEQHRRETSQSNSNSSWLLKTTRYLSWVFNQWQRGFLLPRNHESKTESLFHIHHVWILFFTFLDAWQIIWKKKEKVLKTCRVTEIWNMKQLHFASNSQKWTDAEHSQK